MNTNARKQNLREEIWQRLRDAGVDRFPGARGRIPNFVGAEAAAERLAGLDVWIAARHLKSNPDSPQLPARKIALRAGQTVFMAVPRLRSPKPFIALDPDRLEVPPHRAASIKGAAVHGQPAGLEDLPHIPLVLAGSVAVSPDGARLGKGSGYSDLEFALAASAGLINEATTVVTTVHTLQIVPDGRIPMTDHDVPLDYIVTPERVIATERARARPPGILWDELDEERLKSIPILQRLRADDDDR